MQMESLRPKTLDIRPKTFDLRPHDCPTVVWRPLSTITAKVKFRAKNVCTVRVGLGQGHTGFWPTAARIISRPAAQVAVQITLGGRPWTLDLGTM